jgi:serine protease SohB
MRLRERGFHLTVAVDKVAASGGYLMACVAQEIISSPFAILGSIGVVAQMPNFHRLLQKNHIDFELHTAGNHKRTLTVFGENTDEGREKFRESLHSVHVQFQDFVLKHRPQVDIAQVATGEHWLGQEALGLKLVDTLQTSDDYLLAQKDSHQIYTVRFKRRKSWADRLGQAASVALSEGLAAAAPKVLEKFMQPSATPTHLS